MADETSVVQFASTAERRPEDDDSYPDGVIPVICCVITVLFILMLVLLSLLSTVYTSSAEEIGEANTPGYALPPSGPAQPAQPTTTETTSKAPTPSATTKSTTSPTAMASTTAPTTTTTSKPTTVKPDKDARNFTLICVFEYLAPGLWNKTDQCTDYVFIRLFSYTELTSEPVTFVKKSITPPGKFAVTYYDVHQETWRDYDIKLYNKIKIAMKAYPHARWLVGMWGSTYMRLMSSFFIVTRAKVGLHDALHASDLGANLSMANFSGFAIIHSPIYTSKVIQVSEDWADIFRTDKFSPAALEPNWFFLHTASIMPLHLSDRMENMIRQVMANADLMGLATSNTTYEDNRLLRRGSDYAEYKQASPPNPIRAAHPKARGMLDILKDFSYWKKTLNQSRLCFSVTSAINYATSNVRKIDFYDEIGGQDEAVQRYTRKRFARRRIVGQDRLLPVEEEDCTYGFDNHTQTHFWRYYYQNKTLLRFFAYDKADTLGPKVTQLLDAYPDDKCIVFDDLGEDGRGANVSAGGVSVEFKRYELLHAVVQAMTARYGPAFPAQYY